MAYAATVTLHKRGRDLLIIIDETDAGATDEATIQLTKPFVTGRVIRYDCRFISGTAGTTVNPVLGWSTDPASGADIVLEDDTAAAVRSFSNPTGWSYFIPRAAGGPKLYHRARASNAGSTIQTRYQVLAGWAPITSR